MAKDRINRAAADRSATDELGAGREDGPLTRIIDGGLAGCIFVVPLLLGGRHPLGQLVLVALAVAIALAWVARQLMREGSWRHSAAEPVLLAGVVLLLLQVIPLSPGLLTCLSPHVAEILPMWSPDAESAVKVGTWSTISLTPAATRGGLVLFLAYGMIFLVTVQRIRVVEDVERLLRWFALSAVAIAGFGLLQLLTTNGKFFWFYEHPFSTTYRTAKACFSNRNHFAHFLALGIGPLIWWLQYSLRRKSNRRDSDFDVASTRSGWSGSETGMRGLALAVVLFAVLLSFSRGGATMMLLAVAICGTVCYRASALGPRFLAGLAAVGVMIGVSLSIFGYEPVANRLDDLTAGSVDELDKEGGRRTVWAAVAKAVPDFAALGSGVGSHAEVCPMYLEESNPTEFTHAESGYLQLGLETGAAGLTLLAVGMIICISWCVVGLRTAVSRRLLLCLGAVSAGLAVSMAHSLFDFVWYVPACMAMATILAACACRLCQLARKEAGVHTALVAVPRHLILFKAAVLVAIGGWMVISRIGPVPAEPHWDSYRIAALAAQEPEPLLEADAERVVTEEEINASMQTAAKRTIFRLEQVVHWNDSHARARLRLAAAYLRLFDLIQQSPAARNAMALGQIRDAAIQSRFRFCEEAERRKVSPREVLNQWLSQAVGEHGQYLRLALQHTRRGLALCPLQGEGYLYLAELSFLETARPSAKQIYVNQALKVRPRDGTVLFAAGKEAWMTGDYQQGIEFWQRSFHSGRAHQQQIAAVLVGSFPREARPTEVSFIMETFQPDLIALKILENRYRLLAQADLPPQFAPPRQQQAGQFSRTDQLRQLQQGYAQVAESRVAGPQLAGPQLAGPELAGPETDQSDSEEVGETWLLLQRLYRELGQGSRSLECGRNALKFDPSNHLVRHRLVANLIAQQQYVEAEEHLRWLLSRKPGNQMLRKRLRHVVRQRVGGQDRTADAGAPVQLR